MIRVKARLRLAARKIEIAFFVSLIAYILAALSLFIVPEDILSAHAVFRDFTTFMADFYPAISVAQNKTAFGDVAAFHLSYLCFFMLVCLVLAGLCGVAKELPVGLRKTKTTLKRFRKALFYVRLSYAF